jgi:uncharacterized protein
MTPLQFVLLVFAVSVIAGMLGSLLGLGGGIIVIPALTLLFKIDIRYAVGASIVSVIATSSGAAAAYVREHMTNIRVAMFLELATTSGALTGAYLAGVIGGRAVDVMFGSVLAYSALAMVRRRQQALAQELAPDRWADSLRLHGAYYDAASSEQVLYQVTGTRVGLLMTYGAGVLRVLLGIGSGALKVPAMDLAMHLPIKVSSATSNFMIGVTAAASAGAYFMRGDIDPIVAGPVAAGVLLGATAGSRLLGRLQSTSVRIAFVVVLLWISLQMLYNGLR